jgi:hypothetical protein
VKRAGDKVIKTEIVKQEPLEGWEKYADLLFLAAMAEKDSAKARKWLDAGLAMWDGAGFRDAVVDVARQYATYKLGLAVLACRKLDVTPEAEPVILNRLNAQQASSGGWITDYSLSGKPRGLANVETASLAILALECV